MSATCPNVMQGQRQVMRPSGKRWTVKLERPWATVLLHQGVLLKFSALTKRGMDRRMQHRLLEDRDDLQFPGSSMQWKRPVDHRVSPPAGRPWCIACWYGAGAGADGGGVPLLYLSYASAGAAGYIAWEYGRVLCLCVRAGAKGRMDLVPL